MERMNDMKYEPNEKDYNIYVQNVTPTSNTFKIVCGHFWWAERYAHWARLF